MQFKLTITFDTHNAECAKAISKDFATLAEHYKKTTELIDDVSVNLNQVSNEESK